MKRTKPAPLKRTKPSKKINLYAAPGYRMWWGRYAGKKIKKIPAQWFLSLVIDGWAFGELLEWIEENRIELEIRARKENESGYTEKYKLKHSAW